MAFEVWFCVVVIFVFSLIYLSKRPPEKAAFKTACLSISACLSCLASSSASWSQAVSLLSKMATIWVCSANDGSLTGKLLNTVLLIDAKFVVCLPVSSK